MEYGRNVEHSLLLRFLLVAVIQFGMAGLGILIVKQKNKVFKNTGLCYIMRYGLYLVV